MPNPPPSLTAAAVLAKVRWLENNQEHKKTVEKMRARWLLHSMLDEPKLQPDLTRHGRAVIVNSPRIMETKKTLIQDILSYTTDISVIPSVPTAEKARRPALLNKAQELEKNVVLAWDQLDDGRRVSRGLLEHLLVSSFGVVILECRDCYDDDGNLQWCWTLNLPSPDTCFFPIMGSPIRPLEFARRYRQLITLAEQRYSNQTAGVFKGWDLKKGDDWKFEPRSDDHAVDAGRTDTGVFMQSSPEGDVQECEIVEYYDKWRHYHVIVKGEYQDSASDQGTIVFCEEHRVKGGPPVWVCSGATSEIRGERLQPFLWAIMQMIKLINLSESIIATRSYNIKPDVFIEWAPDDLRAMKEAGFLKPASQMQMDEGMANLIHLGGVPHFWDIPPDDQLRLQIERKTAELQEYLQQIQAITSAEVLEKSTLGLGLVASGNVEKQLNGMLKQLDWMRSEVLQAWCDSVEDYASDPAFPPDGFEFYAKPGMRYGSGKDSGTFEGGEGLSISGDTVDFSYTIDVSTANRTEAMVRVRLEDWARGNELRGRAMEELGEVLGYPNNDEWMDMMARDDVIRLNATAYAGFVAAAAQAYLQIKGINIGALAAFWLPADQQQQAGAQQGGGGAVQRTPEVTPSPGGSGATQAGGLR